MSLLRNVNIHDGDGNPIDSMIGALDVHDADVHKIIVNEYFTRLTGVSDTIATASNVGDTSLIVTNGGLFTVGETIKISGATATEASFPTILSIATNTLNLDRPLDNAFIIGDDVEVISSDMNVVGSLASPVSFKLTPPDGQAWHIVGFLMSMTHGSAGDLGLFGNLTALTNGVVVRGYDAATTQFRTFTVWKGNNQMAEDFHEVRFDSRTSGGGGGGGGTHGTTAVGTIKDNTGAIPTLSGTSGDYVELLIQDDVSALATFRVKAQGHIEGM